MPNNITDRASLYFFIGIARDRSEIFIRHLLHVSVCAKEFLIAAANPVNDLAEPVSAFRIITVNAAYEAGLDIPVNYGNPDAADAIAVVGIFGNFRK